MRRQIFLKSLLLSILSAAIVFVAGAVITYLSNRRLVGAMLVTETKLAAALLDGEEDFDPLGIFNNNDECRVTVISLTGEVLFDSDTHQELENHLDREEIRAALDGQPRVITRYSDTFHCRMSYYAVTTHFADGTPVVLRLSIKNSQTQAYLTTAIPFLLLALCLGALVGFFTAGKLARRVADRLSGVAESLSGVTDGTYRPLYADEDDRELSEVYAEINTLAERTVRYIREVAAEQQKLGAVLDNISQGILALDVSGCATFINRSAVALLRLPTADIGMHLSELLLGERELCDRMLSDAAPQTHFEWTVGGRTLLVERTRPTSVLLSESVHDLYIFSDVTAERELARQKEEFFANAGHELKTPLTAMLGLAELSLAEAADEDSRRRLDRIYKEARRLSDLIADMLKLSRLESVGAPESTTPVALRPLADEVTDELAETIAAKSLTVTVTGEATVDADERRMYELIQNLLANAVNYNRPGGRVELVLSEDEAGPTLTVRDTGIGIAAEHIPHLCERFFRVDKSRSKKTGGTGLGLAIVKHILALYGGSISIDSRVGEGTEITVRFPARP